MKENFKNGKRAKKVLLIGSVVVFFALFIFVGQYMFTQWLHQKLEKTVLKQTGGVYALRLYGMDTAPLLGNVSLDSSALVPDFKRWQQLKNQGEDVSRTLLAINTHGITLESLNIFKMLFKHKVDLGNLLVQNPDLKIFELEKDTTTQHKPMHETVKGILEKLHIGNIKVHNARFNYIVGLKSKTEVFALNDFDLLVDDYKLDSASFFNPNRSYYSKNIILSAKNASFNIPDGFYKLTTDSINVNIGEKSIKANGIKFIPTLSPIKLSRAKGSASTYMKVHVPSVKVSGLDFHRHSENNDFFANEVNIYKPSLTAYKDKKNFTNEGYKPLPHELVQGIKPLFYINRIKIKNGYTRYEELSDKGAKTGFIYFTGINGNISNLTNIPQKMTRKTPAVVKANALIMGKVKMQVTVKLPLLDKRGYHTLKGSIGAGRPQLLNAILVPTNLIKIDKGYVQHINFNVTLNNRIATGSMRAIYRNFEVELLSAGAGEKQSFGKKILSKVADWFLIENNNPEDSGDKPRIGQIRVKRDPESSFITYWKDCLSSGLLASMGLEKMAEKKYN